MTNVDALKELCAAIATDKAGEEITPADVKGDTVADVIKLMTKAYKGESILEGLTKLTLTSEPGTEIGTTKITVTGSTGLGTYKYKVGTELPAYNANLSTWTDWDGTSELELEDSTTIVVCEVNEQNLAVAGGTVYVNSNLG